MSPPAGMAARASCVRNDPSLSYAFTRRWTALPGSSGWTAAEGAANVDSQNRQWEGCETSSGRFDNTPSPYERRRSGPSNLARMASRSSASNPRRARIASSTSDAMAPVSPSSMISRTDPQRKASTGVPQALGECDGGPLAQIASSCDPVARVSRSARTRPGPFPHRAGGGTLSNSAASTQSSLWSIRDSPCAGLRLPSATIGKARRSSQATVKSGSDLL